MASLACPTKFLYWFPIIISLCWSLPRSIKESCITYFYIHIILPDTKYMYLKYKLNELDHLFKTILFKILPWQIPPHQTYHIERVRWFLFISYSYKNIYKEINLRVFHVYIVYAALSDILWQSSFAHSSLLLQKRPDSALRIWGPKISCLLSFVNQKPISDLQEMPASELSLSIS